jgi:uncharacterized membrane-anchored protein YjiN (DUF445 family)
MQKEDDMLDDSDMIVVGAKAFKKRKKSRRSSNPIKYRNCESESFIRTVHSYDKQLFKSIDSENSFDYVDESVKRRNAANFISKAARMFVLNKLYEDKNVVDDIMHDADYDAIEDDLDNFADTVLSNLKYDISDNKALRSKVSSIVSSLMKEDVIDMLAQQYSMRAIKSMM